MQEEHHLTVFEQQLNHLLMELFKKHDIDCYYDEGWLIFPNHKIKATNQLFDKSHPNVFILQLDAIFEIGFKKVICESCAGIGESWQDAANDAFKKFVNNSFHVLLGAFFTTSYDQQIHRQNWSIDGRSIDVVSSNLAVYGNMPQTLLTDWIDQFETLVQQQTLTKEIHWLRLYYAVSEQKISVCETLLDNQVWDDIQDKAATFNVPLTDSFCSYRLFYVLQETLDVGRLAYIMAWVNKHYQGDDVELAILAAFAQQGLSKLEVDKAYTLIPAGFAHAFIKQMAPDAVSTKATVYTSQDGGIEIDLNDEYFYRESYQLAKQLLSSKEIAKDDLFGLLSYSSTFNVFNQALNDEIDPNDLIFSGMVLNWPNYQSEQKKEPAKKSFWRFLNLMSRKK